MGQEKEGEPGMGSMDVSGLSAHYVGDRGEAKREEPMLSKRELVRATKHV